MAVRHVELAPRRASLVGRGSPAQAADASSASVLARAASSTAYPTSSIAAYANLTANAASSSRFSAIFSARSTSYSARWYRCPREPLRRARSMSAASRSTRLRACSCSHRPTRGASEPGLEQTLATSRRPLEGRTWPYPGPLRRAPPLLGPSGQPGQLVRQSHVNLLRGVFGQTRSRRGWTWTDDTCRKACPGGHILIGLKSAAPGAPQSKSRPPSQCATRTGLVRQQVASGSG